MGWWQPGEAQVPFCRKADGAGLSGCGAAVGAADVEDVGVGFDVFDQDRGDLAVVEQDRQQDGSDGAEALQDGRFEFADCGAVFGSFGDGFQCFGGHDDGQVGSDAVVGG